jgi:2,4-dienoyl-CoA reductase-like NADH-dependent reductase (Old Yellow Enzyme family)/NADPH-dependent 2,4-dienoyl-CoA reductase/sulfur reductase-like enzyme
MILWQEARCGKLPVMPHLDPLFAPLTIRHATIKNRFLSTSHAPGYAVRGNVTERYIAYEAEKAKGGVGLVQFGGATAVSVENSFHYGQINGAVDGVIPQYQRMAAAIHAYGALCTVQLTHGGRRERWDDANWLPAFAPSGLRELAHRSFPAEMEDHDINRIVADYARAVQRAKEGNLDGVEISTQAGTLIEQFWSPAMNKRSDGYGGSFGNRVRFGLEVLEACRKAVGEEFLIGIRMPGDEMLKGGLNHEDCIEIARHYARTGLIDFISVVGGTAVDYKAQAQIWPTLWVPSAAYLKLAGAIKSEVSIPIFHATRMTDAATAVYAVKEGYLDMVGMTRAFLADPHHVRKLIENREAEIRPCVGAGYCVDRVLMGKDALCIHNVATGRELSLPQVLERSTGPRRRVVVIGGGPAGLEAARICATRGHAVTLFEATGELGGQVVLAAKATWRQGLSGIVRWLAGEMERLGVAVHLHHLAEAQDIHSEAPEVVIVATGGLPEVGHFAGREFAATIWDILSGQIEPGSHVLVHDESGGHAPLSCAQFLAARGAIVEIVTPDRVLGLEMAETNYGAHMTELYKAGVSITPDARLVRVSRKGNRLIAELENTYTGKTFSRDVDQVVGDYGTVPNASLYEELKPFSRNLGELDLGALARGRPQTIDRNPSGSFFLYRIGDAWAGRNIHAAMLDAMRICKDL